MLTATTIADYCRRFPEEQTGELAHRFGVSSSYIRRLKREAAQAGLLDAPDPPPAPCTPARKQLRRIAAPHRPPRRLVPVAPNRGGYWLCPRCGRLDKPAPGVTWAAWQQTGCAACAPAAAAEPEAELSPEPAEHEAEPERGPKASQSESSAEPDPIMPPQVRPPEPPRPPRLQPMHGHERRRITTCHLPHERPFWEQQGHAWGWWLGLVLGVLVIAVCFWR